MERFLGLMSGTSLDGVDVAAVELGGDAERPEGARLLAFHTVPYDEPFRGRLRHACGGAPASALCALNFELGRRFADAALDALGAAGLEPSEIAAIGSHGQTVWHEPPLEGPGSTLQIGEASVIAERTGIPVVSDFRVRDMAAGGHGAPLTAYFDRLLLSSSSASRAVQNLGGMGNVSALPPLGAAERPIAFDTGPGVALMDETVRRLSGGREPFDRDGRRAARGRVDEGALAEWLADPFFTRPPPRTTGRERFSEARLAAWLQRHEGMIADDLVATLTELTARSVAESYRWIGFSPQEVYLCGGGARNPTLAARLEALLAPVPVRGLETLGWDGDAREAAAFALLARQHLLGIPIDLGWATGAEGPRPLGKWVPA